MSKITTIKRFSVLSFCITLILSISGLALSFNNFRTGTTGIVLYDQYKQIIDFALFFALFLSLSLLSLKTLFSDDNQKNIVVGMSGVIGAALAVAALKAGLSPSFLAPFMKHIFFFLGTIGLYLLFVKIFGAGENAWSQNESFWTKALALIAAIIVMWVLFSAGNFFFLNNAESPDLGFGEFLTLPTITAPELDFFFGDDNTVSSNEDGFFAETWKRMKGWFAFPEDSKDEEDNDDSGTGEDTQNKAPQADGSEVPTQTNEPKSQQEGSGTSSESKSADPSTESEKEQDEGTSWWWWVLLAGVGIGAGVLVMRSRTQTDWRRVSREQEAARVREAESVMPTDPLEAFTRTHEQHQETINGALEYTRRNNGNNNS